MIGTTPTAKRGGQQRLMIAGSARAAGAMRFFAAADDFAAIPGRHVKPSWPPAARGPVDRPLKTPVEGSEINLAHGIGPHRLGIAAFRSCPGGVHLPARATGYFSYADGNIHRQSRPTAGP